MANLNLNKGVWAGRLTADVELKSTQSGVKFCSFTLAVKRRFQREGEQNTDFINFQAWRNTAEFISKYFRKGSSLCVTGSIQTRSWTDSNGQKRYATEVVVDEAMFVDSKSDTQQAEAYAYTDTSTANFETLQQDDELPF